MAPLSFDQYLDSLAGAPSTSQPPDACPSQDNLASPAIYNIGSASNVFTGINYGTVVMNGLDDATKFALLNDLPAHPDISGQLGECFRASRAQDLEFVSKWVDSQGSPELALCIVAGAGVGKTTFANHLGQRLRQRQRLAAAVFFGFAPLQWGVESVVKLVAHQLAKAHPASVGPIAAAIRRYGGPSIPVEVLIENYILEPIRHLRYSHPLVVILDALDEWSPHPGLIEALGRLTPSSSLIRFVVLGRPGLQAQCQNLPIVSYDLPGVAKDVMEGYLQERLARVGWKFGRNPEPRTISQLANKADGVFIWMSTVCSLLEDEKACSNPEETLSAVLNSQQSVGDTDVLAHLYHKAIALRFPKPEHRATLKAFLGAVIALQEPLPIIAFASLVSMEVSVIQKIQADLSPLQTRKPTDAQKMMYPAPLIFHMSFLEFLQSPQTPAHLAFPIDTFASHFQLGKACIEELHRLAPIGQDCDASPLEMYAVRYWPIHTTHGTPTVNSNSNAEWRDTPHSVLLNGLSVTQWQLWSDTFLHPVCPGAAIRPIENRKPGVTLALETQEEKMPGARIRSGLSLSHLRRETKKIFHLFSIDKTPDMPSKPLDYGGALMSKVAEVLFGVQDNGRLLDMIAVAEVAVRLRHCDLDTWLALGGIYSSTARRSASSSFIDKAVWAHRCAVEVKGGGGYQTLRVLAMSLRDRFHRFGSSQDLEESITLKRKVLSLTPPGHPGRSDSLNNLGSLLVDHFRFTGSIKSLEESTSLHRQALQLSPPGHPLRPISLINLAASLDATFRRQGSIESLTEAIQLYREALSIMPPTHSRRLVCLGNLAASLGVYFDATGNVESLDESLSLHRETASLRPPGHPWRPASLTHMALLLVSTYNFRGTIESLDEGISMWREALALAGHCPGRYLDYPLTLLHLSSSLTSRFRRTGSQVDLDEAISLARRSLSLQPPGGSARAAALGTLAAALLHQPDSLEECLAYSRQAVAALPDDRSILQTLAWVLSRLQKHSPNLQSLVEAHSTCQRAIALCPPHCRVSRSHLEKIESELSELLSASQAADFATLP
ncbi:hypothetical protein BKA70DRAFT_1536349 [Coprinopsis sp. MPI-PUGE-AT-0042]|nr:hypothetical protein BKA70DRAFT_1536349 [Coprinopsis sp. MPI-PUGE-AT-0042]